MNTISTHSQNQTSFGIISKFANVESRIFQLTGNSGNNQKVLEKRVIWRCDRDWAETASPKLGGKPITMINGRSSGDGATDGVMDTRFIVEIILNRTEKGKEAHFKSIIYFFIQLIYYYLKKYLFIWIFCCSSFYSAFHSLM